MDRKPTYEELELRIKELERENLDRKLIEDSLIISEEKCRLLSEGTFEAVVWHHKGKIIEANKQYYEMFGYKPEELTKKDAILLTATPDSVKFMREQIALGNMGPYEVVGRKKDGTEFPMEIRVKVLEHKGKITRMAAIRDLTSQKQTEEALRESKERFRNLTEVTSDWIWEVDNNGFYTYVSPKIQDMLGYEPEEVIGKTPFDLMPSEEANRVFEIFNTIRDSQQPLNCLENINLHKDGHPVALETSAVPIFDTGGKLCGYRGVDRDITHRKQVEEKLKRSHDELEKRVNKRTRELDIQKSNLEEANIALKVLLDKRQEDKKETSDNLLTNVKELIVPYLEKIKKTKLDEQQKAIVSIIESNLNEITSPFARKMSQTYLNLTPVEIKVANLIRHGSNSKEISEIMNLSPRTIYNHRKNIRKKLGLGNRAANLRSHLLSIY